MMFFGFLWFIILIAMAVALVYYVQSGTKGRDILQNLGGQTEDPVEILKTRYAKGEVSKEEFEKMRKDLSQ